ncbi:MAG: GNAT family N-acetyltransferase [Nocardia sp.]|nr:GNAT family N-acetyltransferase [Nocardia sp.]
MRPEPNVSPLDISDAGEILTLQRAAYVTEARAHNDLGLPPLRQTLPELITELRSPHVLAHGIRDDSARLVAAVRTHLDCPVARIGRLTVAPDRQGRGLGSRLLRTLESVLPAGVRELHLFTGEHSLRNLALYERLGYREFRRSPAGDYELIHLRKPLRRT